MKPLFLVVLITAVGCSHRTSFQQFKEATGEFAADLPSNWHREGQDDLGRRPTATMTWIAEVAAESEGRQLGAMIHISRFERKDAPVDFKKSTLDPTDTMFGPGPLPADAPANINSLTIGGHPARRYRRDFEVVLGGGLHKAKGPFAMRLEDIVVQTPDAYYVLEYRATKTLFVKHYHAFERLAATFRLEKSTLSRK